MVVTSNPEYARTIRLLRNWGEDGKYRHVLKGYNYRMEGLQGAILRVKLRHLEAWTEARRSHAAAYDKLLADTDVETPQAMDYARHVYHVYAIRSMQRDTLQQQLNDAGIQTTINYPIPLHLQPAYSDLGYKRGDFPHAEKLAAQSAAENANDRIANRAQVELAENRTSDIATDGAADELDNQCSHVHGISFSEPSRA